MAAEKTYQCLKILKETCELLKCPVCLEVITETVELSCRHRICKSCHSSITTKYTDLKCCPLCKKAIARRARVYKDLYADDFGKSLQNFLIQIKQKYNVNVDILGGFDDFKNNIEESENEKCTHGGVLTISQLQKCGNKNSKADSNKFSLENQREVSKRSLEPFKHSITVSENKHIDGGNDVKINKNAHKKILALSHQDNSFRNFTLVDKNHSSNSRHNNFNIKKNTVGTSKKLNRFDMIPDSNCNAIKKNTYENRINNKTSTITENINAFDLLLPNYPVQKSRRFYVNRNKVPDKKEQCIKLLEFQDNENKVKVLKWLNDNSNLFGRLTQTQVLDSETGTSQSFNLPSVSQQNYPRIIDEINIDDGNMKKNGCNNLIRSRAKSLDVSHRKLIPYTSKIRRHSFAGGSPEVDNYQIDEYNTEEENPLNKVEEIALIDIIEDEYLNKIDKELLNKSPEGKSQTVSHKDTKALSKMKGRLTVTKSTKKAEKPNKISDDSGWGRMKHIRRTIRKKEKVPKKLNITLQPTQNTSKNETQKTETTNYSKSADKSKLREDTLMQIKTFDLNKLEKYISENIQKVQTDNTQSTNQENLKNLSFRVGETKHANSTLQNECNDNLTNSKNSVTMNQNHLNINIDEPDYENDDVIVKKERLSYNSNENTIIEESLCHQTSQNIIHYNEKLNSNDVNAHKHIENSNAFSKRGNNAKYPECPNLRLNNLNLHNLNDHHISSRARDEVSDNIDYDVYNQPTQKIVCGTLNSPKNPAGQINTPLNSNPKLHQGLNILDSLEELLKSIVSESTQKSTAVQMLSLPSKLETIQKPVTLFLNQVSLLSKVYPFIDQLRDFFHDLQINELRTTSCKIQTDCAIVQTDKQDTHSPVKLNTTSKTTTSNYLSCFNMSVQTVNVDVSSKQVQTDHETPEGFLISANDFFKTQELTETGIQTDEFSCPECNYVFKECSVSLCNQNKIAPTPASQKEYATGKYTLTEFFDDINFETQDILKQAEDKKKVTGVSQERMMHDSDTYPHLHKSIQEKCESNVANLPGDVVVVNETTNQINKKVELNMPVGNINSQSSSVLEFSVPHDTLTKKRRRIEVLNSDSDSEDNQVKKRPHNKFIPEDDLSIVFCSEESKSKEQSHLSDDSRDTFNYEEYICQALKKYDDDGVRRCDSQSTSKAANTDSNANKSSKVKRSILINPVINETLNNSRNVDTNSKDKENISPNRYCASPEKTRVTVPNTKVAKALLASDESFDDNVTIRKRKVALPVSDDLNDNHIIKKINLGPSTSKTVKPSSPLICENKFSDEMADNIFLDEHNMSQIERDLIAYEKVAQNVNSEDTDIIAATEHNIDYYKIDKQIGNRAYENLKQTCRNSLSENMFNDTLSCTGLVKPKQQDSSKFQIKIEQMSQKSKTSEDDHDRSEDISEHLPNKIDNVFLESDSDQDTEVIANTDNRTKSLKHSKITVLQNIAIVNNESVVPQNNWEDDASDTDIVDTTPQKEKHPIDIRSNMSQRSLLLEFPLPPPPGFGDDEAMSAETNEDLEVLPDEVDNLNNSNISRNENVGDALNSSSVLGNSKELKEDTQNFRETKRKMLETSTPFSGKLDSENLLSLSPIPARSSTLNIIELVKQSKFTPLSISVRPSPQSQKSFVASTPKQKSILSYVVKSETRSENLNTKPCIACTRLSKEQVISISLMTNKKLATYSNSFTDSVTHMIVSVTDKNCVKDHTMKYVLGIASGIWVVNYQWIQECLAANSIIAEEPFEVLDVSGIPGPKTSRLTRKINPLLLGFKFHAAPPFQSTTQYDVEKVISLLGGKVVAKPEDLLEEDELKGIIITEASATQDFEMYEVWLETLKVVTVDIEWLSKSVGQYSLVSLRSFALCSDDSICDLGYPEALIGEPLSYPQTAS